MIVYGKPANLFLKLLWSLQLYSPILFSSVNMCIDLTAEAYRMIILWMTAVEVKELLFIILIYSAVFFFYKRDKCI